MVVAHIAVAIKVDHEGDGGDNNEHHGGDGIQEEAELDGQFVVEVKPVAVEYEVLEAFALGGDEIGCT